MHAGFAPVLIIGAAAALAAAAPPPGAQGRAGQAPSKDVHAQDLHEQVDKVFAKWDSTVSPGCALSVMKDGQIVYKRGYGMADLDHDIPIRPETVFHVASISKQFTAAGILLLAQEHKLALDDDVRKYIPELPDFGTTITLRHLIYHTSGLRDQWELLGLAGWRYSLDLITDDDVMAVTVRQKELNFKPGEKHVYCNTGYTLLAQVIKRVSGKSLREFTSERIFEPLGMTSTHFRDDHAEIVKHIAYGYTEGPDGKGYRLSVTNFDTAGATSLLTTVQDLALWDENFYTPRVGGPELIAQQMQRGKLNSGKEISYGFGLGHGKYRGLETVDHSGADAGYRADLLRFPREHFSVACLCNQAETHPNELTRKVADIYLDKQFKEPPPTQLASPHDGVTLSAEQLNRHAGLYQKQDADDFVRIMVEDGKLILAASADDKLELRPLSADRFQLADYPVTFTFSEAADSSPGQLTVQPLGAEEPDRFRKVPEFKPTAGQLAAYSGSYTSDEIDPVYRIEVENGSLVLKRLKAKPEKLEPTIVDHFSGLNGDLHFTKNAGGKVTGFVLNAGRITNFHFSKAAKL